MKKKPKPDAVYKKVGNRYYEIGHEWSGFPTDGIWLVQDGKSNMRCLIGSREEVSVLAMNYRIHADELCSYLHKRFGDKPRSRVEEATVCCDYFAEVAEKEIK